MTIKQKFVLVGCVFGLVACGSSKSGFDPGPTPHLGRRQKPVSDKDTLTLKTESLKLTHITQVWQLNALNQEKGTEKYLRVQKTFPFPIQFNGWVTLDNVTHTTGGCENRGTGEDPVFALEDDHNGYVVLKPGDRIPVGLEKLYDLVVEFPNQGLCQSVDIQFGVLYGTND